MSEASWEVRVRRPSSFSRFGSEMCYRLLIARDARYSEAHARTVTDLLSISSVITVKTLAMSAG